MEFDFRELASLISLTLAIMLTTFHLPYKVTLDAKEILKVAVACNDPTEYCCLK